MNAGSFISDRSKDHREPLGRFLTFPNVFSISRVFLLIPIFVFLSWGARDGGNVLAGIFMGIAALTDFLDGFTARRLNQFSRWGRILDPICDKICILSIGIFLALPTRSHPLPVWFLGLTVARDLLILAGAYYVMLKFQHVPTSMTIGKWTTFFLALLLFSYTLEWSTGPQWLFLFRMDVLLWICTIMVILSGALYAYRTIRGTFPDSMGSRRGHMPATLDSTEIE